MRVMKRSDLSGFTVLYCGSVSLGQTAISAVNKKTNTKEDNKYCRISMSKIYRVSQIEISHNRSLLSCF